MDEGRIGVTRTGGEAGAGTVARADQQGRILTVPNAISVARLAGVPVFLWLVLGPHADGWAVALLIVAGLSDWLDGVIARAWNQQSRLGQVLDPTADRLYIAATLIALAIRGIIPWWLARPRQWYYRRTVWAFAAERHIVSQTRSLPWTG